MYQVELSQLEFSPNLSFVPSWFFFLLPNLGFVLFQFWSQFEFVTRWACHSLSWHNLSCPNLKCCHILRFVTFEFCPNYIIVSIGVCPYLSFITIWVLSLFEFCHNLSCHILIFFTLELSQFVFCHNLCFVTICVLSKLLFRHNLCFIPICFSSLFVFNHILCFITVWVSWHFVFHYHFWYHHNFRFNLICIS